MKFILSFWKTIIWVCLVTFLSLYSGNKMPHPSWLLFPQIDKVVHFMMYFVFTLVLIHDNQFFGKIRLKYKQIMILSVSIAICWGGIMEILQSIPALHRSTDIFDFLANSAGAVIAAVVFRFFKPLLDIINSIFIRQ